MRKYGYGFGEGNNGRSSDERVGEVDPHGFLPIGFHSERHGYTITGFSAPAGSELYRLMVTIGYDQGETTTLDYTTVLRQFILETSHSDYQTHCSQLRKKHGAVRPGTREA